MDEVKNWTIVSNKSDCDDLSVFKTTGTQKEARTRFAALIAKNVDKAKGGNNKAWLITVYEDSGRIVYQDETTEVFRLIEDVQIDDICSLGNLLEYCSLEKLPLGYGTFEADEFPNKNPFQLYVNTVNIVDSMQLDSGTQICSLTAQGHRAVIEVCGDVNLCFEGKLYTQPSEFPLRLKELIARNDTWYLDDRIVLEANNWFELFLESSGNSVPKTYTVDVEGLTPNELRRLCYEHLEPLFK